MKQDQPTGEHVGLARALSKRGHCSRSQAWVLIRAGRVTVRGQVCLDPEQRVRWRSDPIEVDHQPVGCEAKVYLMLNKPRGLVTTAADDQGRETVFACLAGAGLPFVAPVGRLDKASEGLLLFTNDTAWAARITDPASHLEKVYHVQVDGLADEVVLRRILEGVSDSGEWLAARQARVLRRGSRNCWLELVIDEGRNRHLRRLLNALGLNALRLVRIAIGSLELGALAKGQVRRLTAQEVQTLAGSLPSVSPSGSRLSGARKSGWE